MATEADEWLEKAEEDLETANYLIQGSKNQPAAVFLQQSIEKSLKAVMVAKDQELDFTHNLLTLANKVKLPEEKTKYFARLNTAYTGARYPNSQESTIQNIGKIKEQAEEVIKWTEKQLKKSKNS
jgi:HEPN domain-containing protein